MLTLAEGNTPGLRPGCLLGFLLTQNLCFFTKGSIPCVTFLNLSSGGMRLPHFLGRIDIYDLLCLDTVLCIKDYENYQTLRYLSNN